MTRFSLSALFAAVLLLVGCGVPGSATSPDDSAADSDSDDGSLAAQLLGRDFETTGPDDVTGYELVPESTLTLSFFRDHDDAYAIGGDAGCNAMGGAATWDGETVRTDELMQTMMACEGLMEQESWWAGLLAAGISLALDGDTLTVTAGGDTGPVTITMTDSAVLHPDLPLMDTTWRLDGIVTGGGPDGTVSSVPGEWTASLTISRDADGHLRLDVFDGVTWMVVPAGYDAATGEYSGSVTIEPAEEGVDPLEATAGVVRVTGELGGDAVGCPDDDSDCRSDEILLVGADFAFETHRDRLTVTGIGENDGRGLMFVADPDAPAPDLPGGDPVGPDTGPDTPATSGTGGDTAGDAVDSGDAAADGGAAALLTGRTFELVRTFTDAGGEDHMYDDATFVITFAADSATVESSCGAIDYPAVRYSRAPSGADTVDLGEPAGPQCSLGSDPSGVPAGELMVGGDDGLVWLSTGFVAWHFRPVG